MTCIMTYMAVRGSDGIDGYPTIFQQTGLTNILYRRLTNDEHLRPGQIKYSCFLSLEEPQSHTDEWLLLLMLTEYHSTFMLIACQRT